MKQLLTPASILLVAGGLAWAARRLQVEIIRHEWTEGYRVNDERYQRTMIRLIPAPVEERTKREPHS